MPSTAVISLFAFVPALAQVPVRPRAVLRGGAFAPQYSPAQMPHVEVAQKYGVPGSGTKLGDSRAVSSYVKPAPPAPVASSFEGSGGLTPDQLAFMERQNAARGGAAPVASRPSAAAPVYASSAPKGDGFAPLYAPPYAPIYADSPSLELDATPTSPDVISILAAGLIGAVIGASGVTFMMRFRRSSSSTLKESLLTVSN